MRLIPAIALLVLLCISGSFLCCPDAVAAAAGGDVNCSCLLGGLLGDGSPGNAQSTSSPAGGGHDAFRCSCQSPSLVVNPFDLHLFADPSLLEGCSPLVLPSPSLNGILRPPRVS